ncbi:NAD(P)-binding Rossmann-fold superfamily protein [Dorcoceras hygrometricum]|uniref:NAD(P)-binding Rossmann-fold superfamily protein n=1 Tax=Dorcoceras hygrometricum TaxID=472368 RepID=A0A2Z7B854_9LAMI|nr:NAD(P)-binding Rossmann-fold superfamily protein [Dorcoceras hygrometricum]
MSDTKVALVTGCAVGGIGYEYCKALAEHNCHVIASDIPQKMHHLLGLRSRNVETIDMDVSSEESIAKTINHVISRHGKLDILVNNAGIGSVGPLVELPLDVIKRAYEINALGALRVVQHVVPHMVGRRRGTIVNIGSVVGNVPTPWAGSYCASKAYVHAISHTLRLELKPFNIDVVLVLPGAIKSNFGGNSHDGLRDQEWKIYSVFKNDIEERAKASQGGKSTDSTVFARHVVSKILDSSPPKEIVYGRMTMLFKLLSWSPLWVRDLFFTRRFKLNKKVF